MNKVTNLAKVKRSREEPYASWTDSRTGFKVFLLKAWQADNGRPFARWFTWVESNYSEYGDQYVKELLRGLRASQDLVFDTEIWVGRAEFLEWAIGSDR